MRPRSLNILLTLLALLATMFAVGGALPSAQARIAPSVEWQFAKTRVHVGKKANLSYSPHHVRAADVLRLERRMGREQVWGTVLRLNRGSKSATTKVPVMGRLQYRISIYRPSGGHLKRIWSSTPHRLRAYGRVSLGVLCDNASSAYICGSRFKDTITAGDHTFTYVGQTNGYEAATPPDWSELVSFPTTSCRTLVVNFASNHDPDPSQTGNLQLIQGRSDPQTSSTPNGSIGRLRAKLDGSAFTVRGNDTDGGALYANGFAWCLSANGRG